VVCEASDADVEALLDIGEAFLRYARYGAVLATPDREGLRDGLQRLRDTGVVFVARRGADVVGVIGGTLSPLWFSAKTMVGVELLWWVSAFARGGLAAVRLVRAFEEWASARGAQMVVMSDIVLDDSDRVTQLLHCMGYRLAERAHVKGLS
jgi:hypothetical protein